MGSRDYGEPYKVSKIEGVPVPRAGEHENLRKLIKELFLYALEKYHDF